MIALKNMRQLARRFIRDESGPSSTEYAVLLAMLVLVSMAAIQGIGSRVVNIYTAIDNTIPN